jgi:hypothetical protein
MHVFNLQPWTATVPCVTMKYNLRHITCLYEIIVCIRLCSSEWIACWEECRIRGNSSFKLGKLQQMGNGRGKRNPQHISPTYALQYVCCVLWRGGRDHVVINHSCQNAVLNSEFHMAWRHVEVWYVYTVDYRAGDITTGWGRGTGGEGGEVLIIVSYHYWNKLQSVTRHRHGPWMICPTRDLNS